MPLGFRGSSDSQLSGAFIVDATDAPPPDRVFVITEWTSLTRDQLRAVAAADDPGASFRALNPRFTFLINGLSWPATERLTYRLGQTVRWRIVNLTTQVHPMHLHGFYFTVDSMGDGVQSSSIAPDHTRRVVTQLLTPGGTMAMTWLPERAGNWLFHCHVSAHISPDRRLVPHDPNTSHADHHIEDGSAGMAGMVLGVTVVGDTTTDADSHADRTAPPRRHTLIVRHELKSPGAAPRFGFALAANENERCDAKISVPGPTLVLTRGQPVEITIVNCLSEPTAIHWHGIELESYYDGVHGWSGTGKHVTPLIAPGTTFVVRFTPPRSGTFIYHTHMHDDHQLASGMYGPVIVLDPGESFDPSVDHVVVIGGGGAEALTPTLINGRTDAQLSFAAGVVHRLRFINITPDDVFVASLVNGAEAVEWQAVAKDGAPVAIAERMPRPATQTIAVGETFDFEYRAPPGRRSLWINVRTPGGKWVVQAGVTIK